MTLILGICNLLSLPKSKTIKKLFDAGIMVSLKIIIVILMIAYLSDCQNKCGKQGRNSNAKIYNGQNATQNMFPWYVDLKIGFPDFKHPKNPKSFVNFHGGGTLISKKHILTVAHLFYPNYKDTFSESYLSNLDGSAYAWDDSQVRKFTGTDVTLYPENTKPGKLEFFTY